MDNAELKNAMLARFDSLDFTMRNIEIDADEEMQNHPIGRTTFTSMLDVLPTYVEVARNTGTLSENLQRKLHEAVTEMFIIISRMPGDDFDVDKMRKILSDPDTNLNVSGAEHARVLISRIRDTYDFFTKDGMPEGKTDEDREFLNQTLRNMNLLVLASAITIEDELVKIDTSL